MLRHPLRAYWLCHSIASNTPLRGKVQEAKSERLLTNIAQNFGFGLKSKLHRKLCGFLLAFKCSIIIIIVTTKQNSSTKETYHV